MTGGKLVALLSLGVLGAVVLAKIAGGTRKVGTCHLDLRGTGLFHEGSPVESIARAVDLCRKVNAAEAEIKVSANTALDKLDELKRGLTEAGIFVLEAAEG